MPPAPYVYREPTGFYFSRRAIGFLVGPPEFDAALAFNELTGKLRQELRKHIDHWLQGGKKDNWFHGFPNQIDYKKCFTFKWHQLRQEKRLYGFLCHPKSKTDPGFQLCVLIYYASKNEMGTDYSILDRVNELRNHFRVTMAIGANYKEYLGAESKWRN